MSWTIELIAKACHQVNRAYCTSLSDFSQPEWETAPAWQRTSAINGVKFHLENPHATPKESHQNWLKEKTETGWVFGPVKDADKKQHPCCVPYDELPKNQKVKDELFMAVVSSMRPLTETSGDEETPNPKPTRA